MKKALKIIGIILVVWGVIVVLLAGINWYGVLGDGAYAPDAAAMVIQASQRRLIGGIVRIVIGVVAFIVGVKAP